MSQASEEPELDQLSGLGVVPLQVGQGFVQGDEVRQAIVRSRDGELIQGDSVPVAPALQGGPSAGGLDEDARIASAAAPKK